MENKITIDIKKRDFNKNFDDLYSAREMISSLNNDSADVTISVVAYNRLDITKTCVESIIRNTKDIRFKLILVYNESEQGEGILEYFESVDYDNKLIIHFTNNCGAPIAYLQIVKHVEGKYFIPVPNDVIVTPNWLSNLIKCAESDKTIGMVNPVSSNVSNFQRVNIQFSDFEDMQKKAEAYNVSDPAKWHERLRLVTLGTLFKRECLDAIGTVFDTGFFHDFGDDEVSFRVRRAGYKCILAMDTWVHHDHDFSSRAFDNDYTQRINAELKNFSDKYNGINAWSDTNNFSFEYINTITMPSCEKPSILGVDVKLGTPLLGLKNKLREYGVYSSDLFALTQDAKYYIDLQTICGTDNVICTDIEKLSFSFNDKFDYIIIGEKINCYQNPVQIIKNAASLLKDDGKLFVSLKNTFDIISFLYTIGHFDIESPEHATDYPIEKFVSDVAKAGLNANFISNIPHDRTMISDSTFTYAKTRISAICNGDVEEVMVRLSSDSYAFEITK